MYCEFSDLPKDMCGCQDCRPDLQEEPDNAPVTFEEFMRGL